MDKQTIILPYFPLSIFLFPGEDIPLHIFEPRYKQLIKDARNEGISFAIPYVIDQEIQEFGCEVRLKEVVAEKPGGRMVIVVECLSVVQILSYHNKLDGKLYAGGSIQRKPCSDPVESEELLGLIENYKEQFDKDFLNRESKEVITRQDVMIALNLSSEDKYKFICMPEGYQQEAFLAGQLRYLGMIRKQETMLGNDFGLN